MKPKVNSRQALDLAAALNRQIKTSNPSRFHLTRKQINGLILHNYVKSEGVPIYRGVIIRELRDIFPSEETNSGKNV